VIRFFVQRVVGMIVTMFFVSIMVFAIMELPPGDYADRYAFRKFSGTGVNVGQSDIENIRREFGLDRPAYERYFTWIGGIVTEFDFGQSFAFETSVTRVIGQRLPLTLVLLFATLLLTYAISTIR
jgi:peptide/nickel transport system permease protein